MTAGILERLQAIEEMQKEILRRIGRVKTKDVAFLGAHKAAQYAKMRANVFLAELEAGKIAGATKIPRGRTHSWRIPRESLDTYVQARQ